MIYLDNNATTKVLDDVFDEMKKYFIEFYGNPDAKFYDQAAIAKKAVDDARKKVSRLFNCSEKSIVFNSGATEGNNTVLKSIFEQYNKSCTIVTTKIEHSSIIQPCEYLQSKGATVKYIRVNKDGQIAFESFDEALTSDVKLVAIAWVNSEIGTIQDISKISEICYKKKIQLLVDATQAVGKVPINLKVMKGINYLTCSAHKFGGPKGVGVLYVKEGTMFIPLIHGNQENGFRGGTLNVPGIVGLGKACDIVFKNFNENIRKLKYNTDLLKSVLVETFKTDIVFNNNFDSVVEGTVNVRFIGINNEVLLHALAGKIAASTGSACSNSKPSYVLAEIGLSDEEISESVRFSISPYTNPSEIMNIKDLL